MKVKQIAGLVVVVVGAFALEAAAIDLGGIAKKAAKGASKEVVEREINKDLAKNKCSFKAKTTEVVSCDFSDILGTLKTKKVFAEESGFANDVNVIVEVGEGNDKKNPRLGNQRKDIVSRELVKKIGWWDSYYRMTEGDGLKVFVEIK